MLDGWSFDASDPLTRQVTSADDERPTVGWIDDDPSHTPPATGGNIYTAMAGMSKLPTKAIELDMRFPGATQSVDFELLDSNACGVITFPANATGDDLVQPCDLIIVPFAADKTMVMTFLDNRGANLETEGFSLDPAVQMIEINSP